MMMMKDIIIVRRLTNNDLMETSEWMEICFQEDNEDAGKNFRWDGNLTG